MTDLAALRDRHLWRTAHREADLTLILTWGMTHIMDSVISEVLDRKPRVLTAGGIDLDGIEQMSPTEIQRALRTVYDRSGADEIWEEFTQTTVSGYLRQFAHDQVGDTLQDYGVIPRINYDLFDEHTSAVINSMPNRIVGNPRSVWVDHIQPELVRGLQAGESIPKLADRVRLFVPETYQNRARTIARTETISATNAASEDLANRFKLGTKIWLATSDDRTRESHVLANGIEADDEGYFTLSTGARGKFPGDPSLGANEVINCFPAETTVDYAPGVSAGYKRTYSGTMVTAKTKTGRVLTGTPNHPVLTGRGWVALGDLGEGDDLVCDPSGIEPIPPGRTDPDVERPPPAIGEVFDTLRDSGDRHRAPGRVMDFHGDGKEADVEVVRSDRLLWHRAWQQSGDLGLAAAHLAERGLTGESFGIEFTGVGSGSTPGVVSVADLRRPSVAGHAGPLQPFGSAPAPWGYPDRGEASADQGTADAELLGKSVHGLACFIQLDEVIEVEFDEVRHVPVFNLETNAGWYTVQGGIVAHNCRCTTIWRPSKDKDAGGLFDLMMREEKSAFEKFADVAVPLGALVAPFVAKKGVDYWVQNRMVSDLALLRSIVKGGKDRIDVPVVRAWLSDRSLLPERFRLAPPRDHFDRFGPRDVWADEDGNPVFGPAEPPTERPVVLRYGDQRVFGPDPARFVEIDGQILLADSSLSDDVIDRLAPGSPNLPPCSFGRGSLSSSAAAGWEGAIRKWAEGLCRALPDGENFIEHDAPLAFSYERQVLGQGEKIDDAIRRAAAVKAMDDDALAAWSDGLAGKKLPSVADALPEGVPDFVVNMLERELVQAVGSSGPKGWKPFNDLLRGGIGVDLPEQLRLLPSSTRRYQGPFNPADLNEDMFASLLMRDLLREDVVNWDHLSLRWYETLPETGKFARPTRIDILNEALSKRTVDDVVENILDISEATAGQLPQMIAAVIEADANTIAKFGDIMYHRGGPNIGRYMPTVNPHIVRFLIGESSESIGQQVLLAEQAALQRWPDFTWNPPYGPDRAAGNLSAFRDAVVLKVTSDVDDYREFLQSFVEFGDPPHTMWRVHDELYGLLTTSGLEEIADDLVLADKLSPGLGVAEQTLLWRHLLKPIQSFDDARRVFGADVVERQIRATLHSDKSRIMGRMVDWFMTTRGSFTTVTEGTGWLSMDAGRLIESTFGISPTSWDDVAELVGHQIREDGVTPIAVNPEFLEIDPRGKDFPVVVELTIPGGEIVTNSAVTSRTLWPPDPPAMTDGKFDILKLISQGTDTYASPNNKLHLLAPRRTLSFDSLEVLVDADGNEFGLVRATVTNKIPVQDFGDDKMAIVRAIQDRQPALNWDGGLFNRVASRHTRPVQGPVVTVIPESRSKRFSEAFPAEHDVDRSRIAMYPAEIEDEGMMMYSSYGFRAMNTAMRDSGGDLAKMDWDGGVKSYQLSDAIDGWDGGDGGFDSAWEWAEANGISTAEAVEWKGLDDIESVYSEIVGGDLDDLWKEVVQTFDSDDVYDAIVDTVPEVMHFNEILAELWDHAYLVEDSDDLWKGLQTIARNQGIDADDDTLLNLLVEALADREGIEAEALSLKDILDGMTRPGWRKPTDYIRKDTVARLDPDLDTVDSILERVREGQSPFLSTDGEIGPMLSKIEVDIDTGDALEDVFNLLTETYSRGMPANKVFNDNLHQNGYWLRDILKDWGLNEYDLVEIVDAFVEADVNWVKDDIVEWLDDLDDHVIDILGNLKSGYSDSDIFELLDELGHMDLLYEATDEWIAEMANEAGGLGSTEDVSDTVKGFIEKLLGNFDDAPESIAENGRTFLFRTIREDGHEILGLDPTDLNTAIESAQNIIGHTYSDYAFSSTTTSTRFAESWGSFDAPIMVIDVPEGAPVRGVDAIKGFHGAHEQEVIVAPNARFAIGDIFIFTGNTGEAPRFLVHMVALPDQPLPLGGPLTAADTLASDELVGDLLSASMRRVFFVPPNE